MIALYLILALYLAYGVILLFIPPVNDNLKFGFNMQIRRFITSPKWKDKFKGILRLVPYGWVIVTFIFFYPIYYLMTVRNRLKRKKMEKELQSSSPPPKRLMHDWENNFLLTLRENHPERYKEVNVSKENYDATFYNYFNELGQKFFEVIENYYTGEIIINFYIYDNEGIEIAKYGNVKKYDTFYYDHSFDGVINVENNIKLILEDGSDLYEIMRLNMK